MESVTPSPIIQQLQFVLMRGGQFLVHPKLNIALLRRWVLMVRSRLVNIYGKDSAVLDDFPLVTNVEGSIKDELTQRIGHVERMVKALETIPKITATPLMGKKVFIGHGRSHLWRELKDFLEGRLSLAWDEFNREAVAGYTTSERLDAMLSQAGFAFLVMTAEEERTDGTLHARSNVIHEIGLFQGHLGIRRAIVLLEEGCSEFSNIIGLSQIRFPQGDISARFEEIRRVLEREALVKIGRPS
jgi:predicted nucleotide-binding protein